MLKHALILLLTITAQAEDCENCGPSHGLEAHEHFAAETLSVAEPKCTSWSEDVSAKQQQVIRETMSARHHRVGHALWHMTREELPPTDRKLIAANFGKKWITPPANKACPIGKQPAGEDFLYMHRLMIRDLRHALIKANLPCIKGWSAIPSANDAKWPVPGPKIDVKSDAALARMKEWEKTFNDPAWLKKNSLAVVGQLIEITLHNNMHMRWAKEPPPHEGAPLPLDANFPADWKYDAPSNDYLGDPYSAHVNPIFWKLHGLVDNFIDRWAAANGFKEVAENCGKPARAGCYQWRGKWLGEPMSTPPSDARHEHAPPKKRSGAAPPPSRSRRSIIRTGVLTDEMLGTEARMENRSKGSSAPARASAKNDPFDFVKQQLCSGR